jgi:hypothetical protein
MSNMRRRGLSTYYLNKKGEFTTRTTNIKCIIGPYDLVVYMSFDTIIAFGKLGRNGKFFIRDKDICKDGVMKRHFITLRERLDKDRVYCADSPELKKKEPNPLAEHLKPECFWQLMSAYNVLEEFQYEGTEIDKPLVHFWQPATYDELA